jgi:hypothetical protein
MHVLYVDINGWSVDRFAAKILKNEHLNTLRLRKLAFVPTNISKLYIFLF